MIVRRISYNKSSRVNEKLTVKKRLVISFDIWMGRETKRYSNRQIERQIDGMTDRQTG